jgi:hypothetical protein
MVSRILLICLVVANGCVSQSANTPNKGMPPSDSNNLAFSNKPYIGFGMGTLAGSGRHQNPPRAKIIRVTTLEPYGPGSYYEALTAKGARTVVFEVSGVIEYPAHSHLSVNNDYLTVAGQTAPGSGVAIYGLEHIIRASHVKFEHLKFRLGDKGEVKVVNKKGWTNFSEWDCFKVVGNHIAFLNCTFSWATDELVQTTGNNISFYRCLFMEGLNSPKHHKGKHSKGLLILNQGKNQGDSIAVVQNVFLSCADRNPQIGGPVSAVITNNFIANSKFGIGVVHSPRGGPTLSISDNAMLGVWKNPLRYVPRPENTRGKVYLGPLLYNDLFIEEPWQHRGKPIHLKEGGGWSGNPRNSMAENPPLALKNYENILVQDLQIYLKNRVGAFPKKREVAENRLFEKVYETGEGNIPQSVAEAGGWPKLETKTHTLTVPQNPFEIASNGLTNMENYLWIISKNLVN